MITCDLVIIKKERESLYTPKVAGVSLSGSVTAWDRRHLGFLGGAISPLIEVNLGRGRLWGRSDVGVSWRLWHGLLWCFMLLEDGS